MNKSKAHEVMQEILICNQPKKESQTMISLFHLKRVIDALCETECTCGVTATEHCPEHSDKPTDSKPDYYYKGKTTTYTEGVDSEATCWHCGKTFLCECCDATCRLCGAPFDKSRCDEFKFVPKPTNRQEVEETLINAFNKFIKEWTGSHYSHLIDSDGNDGERFRELIREKCVSKHPPCNHFDEIIALNKDKRDLESHLDSLRIELEEVKKKPCKHVELNEKEVKMFLFGIPKEIHNFDFYNSMQEIAYRICSTFCLPSPEKRELDLEKLARFMVDIRGGHSGFPPAKWDYDSAQSLKDAYGKGELWK